MGSNTSSDPNIYSNLSLGLDLTGSDDLSRQIPISHVDHKSIESHEVQKSNDLDKIKENSENKNESQKLHSKIINSNISYPENTNSNQIDQYNFLKLDRTKNKLELSIIENNTESGLQAIKTNLFNSKNSSRVDKSNNEDIKINSHDITTLKSQNFDQINTQPQLEIDINKNLIQSDLIICQSNTQKEQISDKKLEIKDTQIPHNPNITKINNIPIELPIELNASTQYELVVKSYEVLRDRRGQWFRVPVYSTLGDGMYGRVLEVKNKENVYAAKIIYTNDRNNPHRISAEVLREISLYKDLNDINYNSFPHLPKFYGFKARHQFSEYFAEKYLHKCRRCAVIIMEKCHQTFRQFMILNSKKITLNWIRFYIWQLLNGLARIHSQNLSHRDLKPDNLLVSPINDEDREDLKDVRLLKISDLGMGRKLRQEFSLDEAGGNGLLELAEETVGFEEKLPKKQHSYGKLEMPQTGIVITLPYRPPELLLADPNFCDTSGSHVAFYGKACDIWSVGVIFAELCILHSTETRYWKYIFYSRRYEGNYNGKLIMMLTNICKLLGSPHDFECDHLKRIGKNNWKIIGPYLKSFPFLTEVERLHSLNKLIKSHGGIELDFYGIDLLSRMLQFDPSKRLSAKDALAHPFFESLPYKKMNELGFTSWMSQLSHPTMFRYLKPFSQNQLRAWLSAGGSLEDTQLCLRLHQLPLKPLINQNSKRKRDIKKESSPRLPLSHIKSPLGTLSTNSENRSHNLINREEDGSQTTPEAESQLSINTEVFNISPDIIYSQNGNASKRTRKSIFHAN